MFLITLDKVDREGNNQIESWYKRISFNEHLWPKSQDKCFIYLLIRFLVYK
jgi:hypothetical protein